MEHTVSHCEIARRTEIEYTFNTGLSSLSSLSVTQEWHAEGTTSGQRQRTLLWNYSSTGWDEIENQVYDVASDTTVVVNVPSPANYISSGEVRVMLRCGDNGKDVFDQYIDLVKITASE